jgi:dihydroneopterin aldolase
MNDLLRLEVHDMEVSLLTGVLSEETNLPQPLRVSVLADLRCPDRFLPETPLAASKNYMDLKRAVMEAIPRDRHFNLIESVADHIADTLFVQDDRVTRVEVRIVKLAISHGGESIGLTMVRHPR